MTGQRDTGLLHTSGKIKRFRIGLDVHSILRPQAPHRAENVATTARKEAT